MVALDYRSDQTESQLKVDFVLLIVSPHNSLPFKVR